MTVDRSHLLEIVHYLEALGLIHGDTFYVAETVPGTFVSDDTFGLYWNPESEYEIYYMERGNFKELLRTRDFVVAREEFIKRALDNARQRGHGPLVKENAPLYRLITIQGVVVVATRGSPAGSWRSSS